MNYHKLSNIEKNICTAEQKIAYDLAFSRYDTIKKKYKEAKTDAQKSETIQKGVQLYMEYWENSYKRNDKYDKNAIFAALNAGLENYINGRYILTSYKEIGAMFPANYLKEQGHKIMKKSSYFITKLDSEKKEPYIEEKHGYIFEIEGVHFGVCKYSGGIWGVTELSTGILVSSGKLRKEAVSELEKSVKKIKNILETDKSLKKYINPIKEAYKENGQNWKIMEEYNEKIS